MSKNLHAAQTGAENTDSGELRINVTSSLGQIPIRDATVSISYAGSPGDVIETLSTDSSGLTETVTLPAPPIDLSLEPETEIQPYSEYNITVTAPGYEPVEVTGSELLADTVSLQPIRMNPLEITEEEEKLVNIPPHTLWGSKPGTL